MNGREVSASSRAAAVTGGRVAVVVALTLVLTACSGDDDASPSTTLASPPTSLETPPTTVAATTPETTESTPSTEPVPVTTPPTLPPEPTTTATSPPPDEDQVKQDVIDATIASWTAFNAVKLDPMNDGLVAALATTRTGGALERAVEFIAELRGKNQRSLTSPAMPSAVHVFPDSVALGPASGTATIEYCWLNSNILVETGGGQDGEDSVLNDSVEASHDREQFVLLDGRWLKSGGEVIDTYEGLEECIDANSS